MRRLDYFLAGLGGALMVALFYLLSPAVLEAVQYPAVRLTDNSGNYIGSAGNPITVSGTAGGGLFNPSVPGPIGGTTPSTGAFTSLGVNTTPPATAGQIQTTGSIGLNTTPPVSAGEIELLDAAGSGQHMCIGDYATGPTIAIGYGACPIGAGNFVFSSNQSSTTINGTTQDIAAVGGTTIETVKATSVNVLLGATFQSAGGTLPTVTCSGGSTGTSVTAGSTNNRGSFTSSSVASTSCTLTFSASGVWNQPPFCNFYDASSGATPVAYSSPNVCANTTTCAVTFVSATSKVIGYMCM